MIRTDLQDALSEGMYTRYIDELSVYIVFDGGHGLHLYSSDGDEVDYRTFGDFRYDYAEIDDAKKEVEYWVSELLDYDEYDDEYDEEDEEDEDYE